MRQVFSSPRLENVEGVAQLLREAGIEVRITNGRSYKSGWSGRRSYRATEQSGPQPAVWVVRSDEQPRARALLRESGLLHDTTMPVDSYLPPSPHADAATLRADASARSTRLKAGLLVAIAVVVTLAWVYRPAPAPETTGRAPATASAPATGSDTTPPQAIAPPAQPWRVDMPTALARMLAMRAVEARRPALACLQVDGADPDPALLASLQREGTRVVAGSACTEALGPGADPASTLYLEIGDYRTDGSGAGTAEVRTTRGVPGPGAATDAERLPVRRSGTRWEVVAPG